MNRKDNRNAVLGDLYQFQYGTGNTIEDIGGDYPIYGSNGAVGFTNIYNSEDAPVIGHIGAYAGIVNWASGKHFVTYNGVICKIKDGVNPKFGYYSLLNSGLQKRLRGSTQPFVSYDLLDEVKTYLPDKKIQDNIAKTLSEIDAKIELNNKINSELEQMVKIIYDYWFVQFDFPDKNGKPYKSSGGKMVWSEELKREIPEGWKINNLFQNSLTTILKPKIEKFEGKKEYLATANINDRELTRGDKITYENRESRANMQPIKNSVWFAKMKASKKHLFLGEYSDDIIERNILSTGFMGLKCEEYAFEYLASYISSDIFEITKNEISHGATMQGIGNDDLKFINLLIPEKEIVINYKKKVEDIYKKMDLIRRENFKLVELRDWLLPMLMNGQVNIK